MKAIEAVSRTDAMKPNHYDLQCKLRWLDRLEKKIWLEVLQTHEEGDAWAEPAIQTGEEELQIEGADEDLYLRWLEMQIAYADDETGRYENAAALFTAAYSDWANRYNRTHMPLQPAQKLIFRGDRL